jgi:cytochrome b involved in lipid metabolism
MDFLRIFTRQISFNKSTATEVHQPKLKQFSLKEVAHHCTADSCWMVIFDKVYDLTDFIEYHPGGYEIMLEYGGSDATNAFNEKPHTIEAFAMLDKYLIGELIKQDRMFT